MWSRAAPDKPVIDSVAQGDDFALVHFLPSEYTPPRNPGTEFYVKYSLKNAAGRTVVSDFVHHPVDIV